MEPILLISLLLSFFCVILILPFWIRQALKSGICGKDMHRHRSAMVAESGGVVVILGFLLGVLFYIALKTFYFKSTDNLIQIFSMISVVILISFMGLIDDILGWKIGLNGKVRIIIILLSTIPIVVINAGSSQFLLPFAGLVNIGLFYPLVFVPIAILCCSVGFNTLGGYNGLEAGQGILLLFALTIVTWMTGNSWLSIIALCMVAALFAFLFFNKVPAKVFPGNSITFAIGALFAMIAILGNLERFALFIFIPYIAEVLLKVRGRLKMQSFSNVNPDGSLDLKYGKFYGLEHIVLWLLKKFKKKVYESDVVYFIYILQAVFIVIALILFKTNIFYK